MIEHLSETYSKKEYIMMPLEKHYYERENYDEDAHFLLSIALEIMASVIREKEMSYMNGIKGKKNLKMMY